MVGCNHCPEARGRPDLGAARRRFPGVQQQVERGLPVGEALTVGDGANDLPMLKAAGLGVAFHAKPVVAAEVGARIDHGDLTALLYAQGYCREEFVEE